MPQRKTKDMQRSGASYRPIVTESAAGAVRFDRRHRLRQNCRTQRRRKRASNLRNFESHLKCSLTASAYLISRRKISQSPYPPSLASTNAALEDGYRKVRPAEYPTEKPKTCSGVGGVGRAVEFELRYEMSVMLSY